MGRRVVVLCGGPGRSRDTHALVEAFREGAEAAGNRVDVFHMYGADIRGRPGGDRDPDDPCTRSGWSEDVRSAYRAADVVVLASPFHYWDLDRRLRTAFDLLFDAAECDPDHPDPGRKECALLMAAGDCDPDEAAGYYDGLVRRFGWTDRGRVLCAGIQSERGAEGRSGLEDARTLGASIRRHRTRLSQGPVAHDGMRPRRRRVHANHRPQCL